MPSTLSQILQRRILRCWYYEWSELAKRRFFKRTLTDTYNENIFLAATKFWTAFTNAEAGSAPEDAPEGNIELIAPPSQQEAQLKIARQALETEYNAAAEDLATQLITYLLDNKPMGGFEEKILTKLLFALRELRLCTPDSSSLAFKNAVFTLLGLSEGSLKPNTANLLISAFPETQGNEPGEEKVVPGNSYTPLLPLKDALKIKTLLYLLEKHYDNDPNKLLNQFKAPEIHENYDFMAAKKAFETAIINFDPKQPNLEKAKTDIDEKKHRYIAAADQLISTILPLYQNEKDKRETKNKITRFVTSLKEEGRNRALDFLSKLFKLQEQDVGFYAIGILRGEDFKDSRDLRPKLIDTLLQHFQIAAKIDLEFEERLMLVERRLKPQVPSNPRSGMALKPR